MYVSDVVIICEYVLINYTIVRIFDFTRQRTDTSHIPGGLVRSIRANSQPCMWFSLPLSSAVATDSNFSDHRLFRALWKSLQSA